MKFSESAQELYETGKTASGLVNLTAVLKCRPEGLQALAVDIPIGLLDGQSPNAAFEIPSQSVFGGKEATLSSGDFTRSEV